ncbi:MAG: ATP-dependent DNA helicase [Candidatus Poseidoniales archaeon]|nr:ATP-dependent DNA helicase [Candidatus Poseidoniales archaeon]
MIDGEELYQNFQRGFRSDDIGAAMSNISRLKSTDPATWQNKCTDNTPLIQISDSVLSRVNITLNFNTEIIRIIEGDGDVEQCYKNLNSINSQINKLSRDMQKATLWMKATETDRWLQQLMEATQNSPDDRKILAKKLARVAVINRKKMEKIETLKVDLQKLRGISRKRIEVKWQNRQSSDITLNKQQKLAALHDKGKLVITAGPGSGKTHVLVERIMNLMKSGNEPARILMLTFTVKATSEMSARVERRLGSEVSGSPQIMNFNSFCKYMIENDYEGFGFDKAPIHIDPKFRRFLFEDMIEDQLNEELIELIESDKRIIDIALKLDDLLHNRCADVVEVTLWFEQKILNPAEKDETSSLSIGNEPSKQLMEYRLMHSGLRLIQPLRDFIRSRNGLTFGDQITLFHKRLKTDVMYLESVCANFDHVLVDEFQDNNLAQGEIVKLMSNHLESTCVVGDPNQAIFRFRGANVRNLEDFLQDFEDADDLTRVDLDICYRHSQNIINLSEDLISLNKTSNSRPDIKSGWKNNDETNVSLSRYVDESSEAIEHAKWMERKNIIGYEWDEMAILARSLNHLEVLINHFSNAGIPFVTTSSGTLFRDNLSIEAGMLLRTCLDPVGNVQALNYLLDSGFMGVLKEDATILAQRSKRNAQQLFDSLINIDGKISNRDTLQRLHSFISDHKVTPNSKLNEWMFRVLRDSGLIAKMITQGPNSPISKLISILSHELINVGNFFNKPARFGLYIKQLMEGKIELEINQVSQPGHVIISTIHKAKGLEWQIVVMPSLDYRKPPSPEIPGRAENIIVSRFFNENIELETSEELIRLFYVGATRVIDELVMSRAITRVDKSKPNELFLIASEHYIATDVDMIHPSLAQNPISTDESMLLQLRKKLEISIEDLRIGFEIDDLRTSVRALVIYHIEQLVMNERGINPQLKNLIDNIESIVGRVKYSEFTTEGEEDEFSNWRPERYTWSMLDNYSRCPQKFSFSYQHRLITNSSKIMTRGNIVHGIVEDIGLSKKPLSSNELEKLIQSKITSHINTIPILTEKDMLEISKAVKLWYNSDRSKNMVVAVEQGLEFEYNGRKFYGKVDRVERDSNGALRMIDFKTGKPKHVPGSKGQEQLLLYAHAWQQNYGETPEIIAYDYIMHNVSEERPLDPIKLEKGLARLIPLIDGIEANEFSPTPGEKTCEYCDHSPLCPDRY